MSRHAALVFVVGLAALCVAGAVIFFVWLVCAIAVDLYHHLTRQHVRIKRRDLNWHRVTPKFNVGRDAK